jgi:hypothetical protein
MLARAQACRVSIPMCADVDNPWNQLVRFASPAIVGLIPRCRLRSCTTCIRHRASGIRHRASGIGHRASMTLCTSLCTSEAGVPPYCSGGPQPLHDQSYAEPTPVPREPVARRRAAQIRGLIGRIALGTGQRTNETARGRRRYSHVAVNRIAGSPHPLGAGLATVPRETVSRLRAAWILGLIGRIVLGTRQRTNEGCARAETVQP